MLLSQEQVEFIDKMMEENDDLTTTSDCQVI